jgi:hypothetical protein
MDVQPGVTRSSLKNKKIRETLISNVNIREITFAM